MASDSTSFDYRQARAYAGQYGAVIGLMCIASFGCYIAGLAYPLLGQLALLLGIASVIVCGRLIRSYRLRTGEMKFRRCWWMAYLVYMYAVLLTALGQFIYFRFIDNGFMATQFENQITRPEMEETLQLLSPDGSMQQMIADTIQMLQTMSAADFTINLLFSNILLGLIGSVLAAWIGCTGKKKPENQQ